jgi:sodium/bile acid cotransporter 7
LVHWRLHAIILAFTFVAFPLLAILLRACLHSLLPDQLWVGVFYVRFALYGAIFDRVHISGTRKCCRAVAAASVSQVLGILLTPLLVGVMVGAKRSEVNLEGLQGVIVQILVPFALGQFLRKWIGDWVARNKSTIFITDRVILLSIFSAFSTAVREGIWKLIGLSSCLFFL